VRNGGSRSVRSGPRVANQVRVLRAELQSSVRALMQAYPEPNRSLDQALSIDAATAGEIEPSGRGRTRQALGVATGN